MSVFRFPRVPGVGLVPALLALVVPAGLASAQSVSQINLIGDKASFHAKVTDPAFVNPWGIAIDGSGPFWFSANGVGTTPIYGVTGVSGKPSEFGAPMVPLAKGEAGTNSAPSGQVANPTLAAKTPSFMITDGKTKAAAIFLVDTEDGTIAGWAPTVNGGTFVTVIDNHQAGLKGAVYKGLTTFTDTTGTYLLAANFRAGLVEVYDGSFKLVGSFRDHTQPAGHAPFNVQTLGGKIYVAYAQQDSMKHDDKAAPGNGVIETVDIYGTVSARTDAAHIKTLDSAWGLTLAPSNWTAWKGQLLVGNFGNGWVNVFDATTLKYVATVNSKATGKPLVLDGLWGLQTGNGGSAGATTAVYFTAGPNGEADGLFGALTYSSAN